MLRRSVLFGALGLLGLAVTPALAGDPNHAEPRELRVFTSGGFTAAFTGLAARYERETGVHIVIERGP
jgi:molybdate transport system substrate-binding protein